MESPQHRVAGRGFVQLGRTDENHSYVLREEAIYARPRVALSEKSLTVTRSEEHILLVGQLNQGDRP